MKDKLYEELLDIQAKLLNVTNFMEKLDLKDRELEIKIELGLTQTGDSYEACENCSA